ncbi:MAG: hypothetical protein J6N18_01320 [Kiritimatiellae bacterium]|nr:hypothetical protein [Kiritimatiellia bacterium]
MSTMILAAAAVLLSADFTQETVLFRRELHSTGSGPTICSCPQEYIEDLRSMGFKASRTHDWALINPGQRVCDYFHIFPLMHLDAKDPANYVFGPTDYLLKRTREEVGHDIFFRLGTSIEHSGNKVHFNALIPEDFDKVAETFAATVRHYNRGWADGFHWGIKYWEIWNEPNLKTAMWFLPGGDEAKDGDKEEQARRDAKRRDLFVKFFVTVLKRLKSEFPDIKVGGPAFCWWDEPYARALFDGCRAAGVEPDFLSWHRYSENPAEFLEQTEAARALCDEYGFKKCELIINEWHYFGRSDYDWEMLRSPDPEIVAKIWSGPRSHNGIDSSCFNLAVLSQFQTSKLDQAYYYGCKSTGAWGYMDEHKRKFKVFYGLQLFGRFANGYAKLCAATGLDPADESVVTVLAGKSADGRKQALLVSDYRVRTDCLVVDMKGVPADAKVTATVHDYTRDIAPADFTFENGRLTLRKPDCESAAFLIEFEPHAGAAGAATK